MRKAHAERIQNHSAQGQCLQRLYPVKQILCGFHGVLAAKGDPHAAGKYVRQGSGLRFEQGGVHAAQRLAVGGAHLVRDAAEVPVIQLPGSGTRLAGRVQLGGGAYDELVQIPGGVVPGSKGGGGVCKGGVAFPQVGVPVGVQNSMPSAQSIPVP